MFIELPDVSSSGIEFRSLGAATANALSLHVFSLAFGIVRRCWEDDLTAVEISTDEIFTDYSCFSCRGI